MLIISSRERQPSFGHDKSLTKHSVCDQILVYFTGLLVLISKEFMSNFFLKMRSVRM